MKQGPHRHPLLKERESKRQKIDSAADTAQPTYSPVEHALSIPEIVATISNFCPLYSIRGQNNLMTVSKLWHKVVSESDFYDTTSFESLIKECLKLPEGVIYILRDKTLMPYLQWWNVLKLISCNKEFAIHLLQIGIFRALTTEDELITLAKHHVEVGMYILSHSEYRNKLFGSGVISLGCQHPQIAEYILQTPELYKCVSVYGLKQLAGSNVDIAKLILSVPVFFEKLSSLEINDKPFAVYKFLDVMIETCKGLKGFEFIQNFNIKTTDDLIYNLEELFNCSALMMTELEYLGTFHSEIAMKILKTPNLAEKFQDAKHVFAIPHENVAIYILASEEHWENLDESQLYRVCASHPKAVEILFNNAKLLSKLSLGYLISIGRRHPSIAMSIFKTKLLCAHLKSTDILDLAFSCNPNVIEHILISPELYNKLSAVDLKKISFLYPRVIRKILGSVNRQIEEEHLEQLKLINQHTNEHFAQLEPSPIAVSAAREAHIWNVDTHKIDVAMSAKLNR